jgi:flagellin FlaB
MLIVAGLTTSVIIQTMGELQETAMKTSSETIRDISTGLKVTHVSGYNTGSTISQLAIFIMPIAASQDIDLKYGYISLSDSTNKIILNYSDNCFSSGASNGLFNTLNSSNLTSSTYGIMVIRDVDNSCSSTNPVINNGDLVVLLINTTMCFSGINTRTDVNGMVYPENGIGGVVGFTSPSIYSKTIIDLQP